MVALLYFTGKIQMDTVLQAGGAFAGVLAATSLIITQFERLSGFAAGVTRIDALWTGLTAQDHEEERDIDIASTSSDKPGQIDVRVAGNRLQLADLDVQTPDGSKTLLKELNLNLKTGISILLMGPSGSGKSSLLRTIAELWNTGSGSITRPAPAPMMFLPQRPCMVQGSLRDQLLYPGQNEDLDTAQITAALKAVNRSEVVDRVDGDFDRTVDWTNVLSIGEQQRIPFALLLLRKPSIAFLDEATSALDEANETRLYQLLQKNRVTYVSAGHRSTLKNYHDQLLTLQKVATWSLDALPVPSPAGPNPQPVPV